MRIVLLALFHVLVALHCCGQSGTPGSATTVDEGTTSTIPDMTPQVLATQLDRPGVHVYDSNEADLYAEMHVPGAVLIVYDQITVDQLPADRNAVLVFYCYSPECPASHTAAQTARSLGYTNVHYMLAGIIGWQDAGMRTEP